MKRSISASLIILLGSATGAFASPATESFIRRVQAISGGDVAAITSEYAKGAVLHWVGGPLDGTYSGAKLDQVWTKFTTANGPLQVSMQAVDENANPKGSTVAADVVFSGKNTVKVRYVVVYREGKLVDEIWQIDPNL